VFKLIKKILRRQDMKKSILLGGLIVGVGFVPQELVAKGNKAGKPVGFLRIAGKGFSPLA
jgi:hypothetical protein